jgi:hypothetical protein
VLLLSDGDVDLRGEAGTVSGRQARSTNSSTFSYFLSFRRELFFDFDRFYSAIGFIIIITNARSRGRQGREEGVKAM